MFDKQLKQTQNALLNVVRTAQAPIQVRKVLLALIKKFNFKQARYFWASNGYQEEGFQYLIIDGLKKDAVRICRNIDAEELEQLITDIVFAGIPA